jgi:DNA polymerase-1
MKQETPMSSKLVFDIEADGLDPTQIWCVCAKYVGTPEVYTFTDVATFKAFIKDVDEVIGHNVIGYDVPVLERLWDIDFSNVKITDTLVLSRLSEPSKLGGHSLKKWGEYLQFPKDEYSDWSRLTPEMIEYCKQDVKVTEAVYKRVLKDLEGFSDVCIELEHKVITIINQQQINGWLIDEREANVLHAELCERKQGLVDKVLETFKPLPVFIKLNVLKHPMKANGQPSMAYAKQMARGAHFNDKREWGCIEYPEFNLASRQQIVRYLEHFGWTPTKFTDKGNAMVDESVLKGITDIPECVMIAEYFLISKREAMLRNILGKVGDDTRIHGYVNTNGAITGRMTHSDPNMAQIPASKHDDKGELIWGIEGGYGADFRNIFKAEEGYVIVGCDASGLELRMLAHYMNDEEYTNEILHGDIHTANQVAAGLQSRNQAKTFIYAFLYGAGDAKVGSIVNGGAKDGKRLKTKFLNNTPPLRDLRERVGKAAKRGYVKGLDGRKIWIRSEHAALNSLLQGAGAIVMKKALTILDDCATIAGLDYKFVGNIHDEYQTEVLKEHADAFGVLAVEAIREAGQAFEMRCPLDGEYKVALTWAGTH